MSTSLPPPTGDEYRGPGRSSDRQTLALLFLWAATELAVSVAATAVGM